MSQKHTPGPWVLRASYIYGKTLAEVCTPEGDFIASIGEPRQGNQLANARLIAAAPTMYAALRQIARNTFAGLPTFAASVASEALKQIDGVQP